MMHILQSNKDRQTHPSANTMNAMGYDYFIPGNHDFNFGQDYLNSFLSQLQAKTLCANILNNNGDYYFQQPYDIHTTKDGIKIAIIGLTTEYIPNWEQPTNIIGIEFASVIESLKTTLKEVKLQEPHAIVVAYHGGFEKDLDSFEFTSKDTKENVGSAIIEHFPEIDVLLTGHQHRKIGRLVNNILVSQPGSKGELISEITLSFEQTKDWTLKSKTVKQHTTENVESSKVIENLVAKEEQITQQYLNKVIGQVKGVSMRIEDQFLARVNKHPIVSFINQIQKEVSGAMLSCMSLANDSTGFEQEITVRNVFSTYPFPNTLTVLKINGKELKLALEENAKYFTLVDGQITVSDAFSKPKEQHYNYDMFDGITYTIKVSNDIGQRIVSLRRNNREIMPEDIFTLVLNNYRASGGGDFAIFRNLDVIKEIPTDVPILIIDYIQAIKTVIPSTKNNITILK
jgi:2',3'-cyclic-nucleotide 2'-phosphodiesterase/3'-nucleotidase